MSRTATRIRVKLKDGDRERLASHGARNGRTLENQGGAVIAEWLDREDRKERTRQANRGAS